MPASVEHAYRYRVNWGSSTFDAQTAVDITRALVLENCTYGASVIPGSAATGITTKRGTLAAFSRVLDEIAEEAQIDDPDWRGPSALRIDSQCAPRTLAGLAVETDTEPGETLLAPDGFEPLIEPTAVDTVLRAPDGVALQDPAGQPLFDPRGATETLLAPNVQWYTELDCLIELRRTTRWRRVFAMRSRLAPALEVSRTYLREPESPVATIGDEIRHIRRELGIAAASPAGIPGAGAVDDPMRRGWIIARGGSARSLLSQMGQFAIGVAAETHLDDIVWWHRRPATGVPPLTLSTDRANSAANYSPQAVLVDERDGRLVSGLSVADFELVEDMGIDNEVHAEANTGSLPTVDPTRVLGTHTFRFDSPAALRQYINLRNEAEQLLSTSTLFIHGPSLYPGSRARRRLNDFASLYGRRLDQELSGVSTGLTETVVNPSRARPFPTAATAQRTQTFTFDINQEVVVPAPYDFDRSGAPDRRIEGRGFRPGVPDPSNLRDWLTDGLAREAPAAFPMVGAARQTISGLVAVTYETYEEDTRLNSNQLRVTATLSPSASRWGLVAVSGAPATYSYGPSAENVDVEVTISPKGGAGPIPKTLTNDSPYPARVENPGAPTATRGGTTGALAESAYASQARNGLRPLQVQDWLDPTSAFVDRQAMLNAALQRRRVARCRLWLLGDQELGETVEQAEAKAALALAIQPGWAVSVRSDRYGIAAGTVFMVAQVERDRRPGSAPSKILHLIER